MASDRGTCILSHRIHLPDEGLWWGRIELFAHAICLSGWTLRGRYYREVSLSEVAQAHWWTGHGINFALQLRSGEAIAAQLTKGAGQWKFAVDNLRDRPAVPPGRARRRGIVHHRVA